MIKRLFCTLALLVLLCALVPAAAETEEAAETPAYNGYVYVQAGDRFGWYPLPFTEEESWSLPINMTDVEGHRLQNVIRFTPEGVYMESSTCENQDCVMQGTVTLDNLHDLVLGGWIICLPHQVQVWLATPEEFEQWYQDYLAVMQ